MTTENLTPQKVDAVESTTKVRRGKSRKKSRGKRGPKKGSPTDLTYSVPQAGAMIGLSKNGSYAAAKRGEIPVLRFGKLLRVPRVAFERMLGKI